MDLAKIFDELNLRFFDGFLDAPVLCWNSRLRLSAGRFHPGKRKWLSAAPAKIEIASYLLGEENPSKLVQDTLGHEMIHYWLWVRGQPFGHTPEFHSKMREMGVSRYNPVPKRGPFRWIYACSACRQTFPARKKLVKKIACAKCCKTHSDGKYDVRFRLEFQGPYISSEAELASL